MEDKRRHTRHASNRLFRIYTNVTSCKYTVTLKDISNGGAFIKTSHLPAVNEVITYVVLDERGAEKLVGNARVVWVQDQESQGDVGFGIEVENDLYDEIERELGPSK